MRYWAFAWAVFAAVALLSGCQAGPAGLTENRVTGEYTLGEIPLAQLQPAISNDRKLTLGSVGSDLWHSPEDPPNRFWMITDRGPNGQVRVKDKNRRTFPVPEFTPTLLYVETAGDKIDVVRAVPIVDAGGTPVTGLPNLKGYSEKPYAFDGQTKLEFNSDGLDTEGFVRTRNGDFWVVEEYGPSIVHLDGSGVVLQRYVPQGLELQGATYPVVASLPGILTLHKENRGFEGAAISTDEKTLYAVVQSPLNNPDKNTGETSRVLRILAFDIPSAQVTAEYAYVLDPFLELDPRASNQADIKVSGAAMLGATRMLVLERTKDVTKLYAVDLDKATNVLGSRWDDPSTQPSLETTDVQTVEREIALPKQLIADLGQLPSPPRKIEGVAILDSQTVAVANDNDFEIGQFDAEGNNIPTGVPSKILLVELAKPLTR